jgi:hypothetical protein
MDEEQEARQLAMQTAMSLPEARFFCWLLADWQRKYALSDDAIAEIKHSAIDAALVQELSPVTVLRSLYQAYNGYQEEQTRESFTQAMEFKAGIRRLEQEAGQSLEGLRSIDRQAWLDMAKESK